jgi:vacuolar-type H+-ATPase subunit I/STV1
MLHLSELKSSNSQFTETLRVLKSLEPKEIKETLDKIAASLATIQSTAQSTIEASNDIMKAQADSAKNVDEILQKQSDAISKLEARLNSRTALIPLIFLSILAIAGVIIGRVLGIV